MPPSTFRPLVDETRAQLAGAPRDAAQVTFRVESRQESGLRSRVAVRGFEIGVDEPPALGGTDTAPNPVEYVLAALATCQEITYRLHADYLGIPLDGVAVALEGDLDLRGFFAVDPAIRPGFTAIRGRVTLDSPAPPEELARLKEHVDAHCPVLDLLTTPTPLALELATTPSTDSSDAAPA
jgi:uncharacterized OsmC-like protein